MRPLESKIGSVVDECIIGLYVVCTVLLGVGVLLSIREFARLLRSILELGLLSKKNRQLR